LKFTTRQHSEILHVKASKGADQFHTKERVSVMVCISRAANREKFPKVKRIGLSIDELCAAADISRSFYERMKRQGKGPKEMRLGKKVIRISPAAAEEWVRGLEANRSDADAA
jgi:predicted DNA-binding transcriptional regulator AlpA